MQSGITTAGFDGTLDMRGFELLRPRTDGSVAWRFNSARRCRTDAHAVLSRMSQNNIVEEDLEL